MTPSNGDEPVTCAALLSWYQASDWPTLRGTCRPTKGQKREDSGPRPIGHGLYLFPVKHLSLSFLLSPPVNNSRIFACQERERNAVSSWKTTLALSVVNSFKKWRDKKAWNIIILKISKRVTVNAHRLWPHFSEKSDLNILHTVRKVFLRWLTEKLSLVCPPNRSREIRV